MSAKKVKPVAQPVQLQDFSTAELEQEIARRVEEERAIAKQRRVEFNRRVLAAKPVLLSLMDHSRSSCSDDNPSNGQGSRTDGGVRCAKCGVMDLDVWNLEGAEVLIDVQICYPPSVDA